jgi:type IV secretion system protein TrbL
MGDAYAQTATNNRLDRIVDLYQSNAGKWEGKLRDLAWTLFWLLALIEFTWAGLRLALRGADFGEWVQEVVQQILFLGFFSMLLRYSTTWAKAIVNSFVQAGGQASAAAGGTMVLHPSNIFDAGLQLALKVRENTSILEPVDSLGLLICALIILACFALIAMFMILALIEAYVVISAGVLMMGFGGSRWTKDYAIRTFQYALSVGAKLFVLILLVGLAETMFQQWLPQFNAEREVDVLVVIGASIVMLGLTKNVPAMVQDLINGTSISSGSALVGAAAAVGGAAVGAATSVVGTSIAAGAAGKLASAQIAASTAAGAGPTSTMARMAQLTGNTFKNLGSAAVEDVGRRLSGRAHHGTMAGRMADSMQQRARALRADADKPQIAPPRPSDDGGNTIRPA